MAAIACTSFGRSERYPAFGKAESCEMLCVSCTTGFRNLLIVSTHLDHRMIMMQLHRLDRVHLRGKAGSVAKAGPVNSALPVARRKRYERIKIGLEAAAVQNAHVIRLSSRTVLQGSPPSD